jgi:hypothetical protein
MRTLLLALLITSFADVARADWAVPLESPQSGDLTAFAARSDGTFYACKVNGNVATSSWTATSHGKPGQGATGDASVHFHSTNTDIYVFVRTLSGNLYLRTAEQAFNNDNATWTWVNLGKPSTTTIESDPSSVSYNGLEYAFVVGSDGRLHVVYGAPWTWSDQGTPAGVSLVGTPSALVYDGKLYAFVVGDDGLLHVRYWNGSAWSWVSLGAPPSGTVLEGSTAAVTYDDKIHVFVRGADDHVYIRFWNGSGWQWSDQGAAPNGIGAPDAAWFSGVNGKKDLYMFALRYQPFGNFGQSLTPRLFENHWDSFTGWETDSHGEPATLLFRRPSIAGAFGGAIETWPTWRVNVFVRARSDRIYRRLYGPVNGVWQWSWPSQYCQM